MKDTKDMNVQERIARVNELREAMENKALINRIAQLDQNMRNIRIAIVVIILLWFVMMAILN